ncbi:aminotransferase class I/II-fold pyridoxal phosphate-dependent enzyme [Halobaculum sp. MBLA0147]|uniref:aminotransferase class I/II-fold pyridoxal phosphate-dependent enzyme n=1 Tax=Halobaculum sp. MBLA0147 TaxID=3079934 RepID=UPI00352645F2
MQIAPFELERWFDDHEHDAEIMLAESGIRSLPAARFDLDPGKLGYVIPTDGDPAFRAEVAARYDRSADEVAFTCGTQEANFLTFLSLVSDPAAPGHDERVGQGTHAVVVTPTYQALHSVPAALGDVTRVQLDPPEWRLDTDAVRRAVREDTAVLVLNNPNNPTGRYHPEARVRELYDIAAEHDAYLLCDEVYRGLAPDPLPRVASMGRHGISTTSLTKAYGLAGTRFGWVAGPAPLVQTAVRWKDYTTISPSLFGQHVAKQALGDQETEILETNRALAREHHEIVADWLATHDLDWHDPVGVNAFPEIPDGFDGSRDFCRTVVEEASVVLAPGDAFGVEGHFRLGFGHETAELREGLARIGDVIERHGSA